MALRASTIMMRTEHDLRIPTIVAGSESCDRRTLNWGQRTIEGAHNRAHAYLMGGARARA